MSNSTAVSLHIRRARNDSLNFIVMLALSREGWIALCPFILGLELPTARLPDFLADMGLQRKTTQVIKRRYASSGMPFVVDFYLCSSQLYMISSVGAAHVDQDLHLS